MAKKLVKDKNGNMVLVDEGTTGYQASPDVRRLEQQKQRMGRHVEQLGGKTKHGGPTIFGRVMDVISRPSYATAEAIRSSIAHGKRSGFLGSLEDAAVGAGRGLAGTQKTSNMKTLQEHGVKNKWAAIGLGLAGDIALDPTTWAGGGIIKAGGEAAKFAEGARAFDEAYNLAKGSTEARQAGRAAALLKQVEAVKDTGKGLKFKELLAAAKDGADAHAIGLAKAAEESAKDAAVVQKAGLKLRFGKLSTEIHGLPQPVEKVVEATKIPKVTKKIVESNYARQLSRNFRTEGTFGRELNESRKFANARGVASYDEMLSRPIADIGDRSWLDLEAGMNRDEAKKFFRAYELGDLTSLPSHTSKGVAYEDVAKAVKRINKEMYDAEKDAGIFAFKRDKAGKVITDANGIPEVDAEELDNYIYHHVNNSGSKAAKKWKNEYRNAVASDAHAPGVKRALKTAEQAPPGVDIEKDVRLAMRHRIAKHTQTMARRNFLDNAVENFGIAATKDSAKALEKDGHDLVHLKSKLSKNDVGAAMEFIPDNVYVHKEIADKLGGVLTSTANPGEFIRLADKVVQRWKPLATVYNPGHHVRNFVSDMYLNFLDGVVNPEVYSKAMKLRMVKNVEGSTKIGEDLLRDDQLLKLFKESGASPGFLKTDVAASSLAGKPSKAAHAFSEAREETGRLAHFIDSFKKEAKGISHGGVPTAELQAAADRAAMRVKKWNLDYADLTDFEKSTMKRLIPFYTWMRKSTPLMIEAMALRPGKVAVIPKGLKALEQLAGVNEADKLPQDMIPKWIREVAGVQLGNSSRGNPLFFNNPLPVMDPFNLVEGGKEGILRNALSSMNPIPKAAIEQATGQSLFTGAPIKGTGNYTTDLVPASRLVRQLMENGADPSKDTGNTKLINWLTGMGLYEVTPNNVKGELRRQMDPMQAYVQAENARRRKNAHAGGKLVRKDGKLVWQR